MDKTLKWIILTAERTGSFNRSALDKLAAELENIPDNDPRFFTPRALHITKTLDAPTYQNIHIICYIDKDYPSRLKDLSSPPAVLYVKGDPSVLFSSPSAAVVGSRNASAYGLEVTAGFCRDFCEAGITIISGGARGIDSAAARTALKFGGKTIAVLGCGIDIDYPAENKELFQKIAESKGCVISEYFFGTSPIPALFPRRNRIIAALSDCCVVTEAGLRSGSLITANLALDMRKPLFAVPGNITSKGSEGTNHLIKTGAIVATGGMQIAAEMTVLLSFNNAPDKKGSKFTPLPFDKTEEPAPSSKLTSEKQKKSSKTKSSKKNQAVILKGTKSPEGLTPNEAAAYDALTEGSLSAYEIEKITGLNEVSLAPALTMLELKGLIRREYGEKYTII